MKAYLVKFTATTRIVVEDDSDPNKNEKLFNEIANSATEKIIRNGVRDYLNAENADIAEDTECPAGTLKTDAIDAIV